MANFGDFQLEIYLRGLEGVHENLPLTYLELERRAGEALAPEIVSYVAGGAGDSWRRRCQNPCPGRWISGSAGAARLIRARRAR